MRLDFPNGEHAAVELKQGTTTLGSGARCDVRLHGEGITPQHARFEAEGEHVRLHLRRDDAVTALNGGWLHHETELHVGDLLRFGPVVCQLVKGHDPQLPHDQAQTRLHEALPSLVLRGLSGPVLGRSFALQDGMVCGRHRDCDIRIESLEISRRHAQLNLVDGGVEVVDLESTNGSFVNGERVTRAVLHPGDELALDDVRFALIEPGRTSQPKRRGMPPPRPAWVIAAVLVAIVVLALVWWW
ncbi:MAG TPA: FHA domain-containing protein [Rhodanobacteraceae bacterium]|nr:FHA domain-containing protein [Rhodanobacteraceae bacterium]